MIALFRTELVKQIRRPRTYVALGIAALIPVILTIALKANPPIPQSGEGLLALAPNSGLFVPFDALRFLSRFFLVLLAALFEGAAVAADARLGHLRYMLVRPMTGPRILGPKLS